MTPLPDDATCLGCGYRLRGLPEPRCPECGRGFAFNDRLTYRSQWPADQVDKLRRRQRRHARRDRLFRAAGARYGPAWAIVAIVAALIAGAQPSFAGLWWLFLVPAGICLLELWAAWAGRTLRKEGVDVPERRWRPGRWIYPIAVAVAVLHLSMAPLFWLHRPVFEAAADRVGPGETLPGGQIGIYRVDSVRRCAHGVHVVIDNGSSYWWWRELPGFFRRDAPGRCWHLADTFNLPLGGGWTAKIAY